MTTLTKKIICIAGALCFGIAVYAQNVQSVAEAAAKAMADTPKTEKEEEKPNYWTQSLITNFGFTETSLTNWAAGGYNTITLLTSID